MLLILIVWILRYAKSLTLSKITPLTAPELRKPVENPPVVSVILAARNEQETIERCLASLSDQNYNNYEIIVADDRSTDKTGQIVRENYPGVTLVPVSSLPEGCAGKSHAISIAVKHARGKWLLFTDADTVHSKYTILAPLNYAIQNSLDMLSLLPQPITIGFWEKTVQPLISLMLFKLFPLERINRRESNTSFACGQYILIRRDAYDKIGGHEELRTFPLEDIEMARNAKDKKLNTRLLFGSDTFQTRMYSSLRELWIGWGRIYYLLFCNRIWVLPIVILFILILSILPYIGIFFQPWTALLQLLFMHLSLERAYSYIAAERRYIWTHPLGCLVMMGILWSAFWKKITKQGVTWRGKIYHEWSSENSKNKF